MFSNPSRPILLRSILLITAGLSLLAVWDLIGLAHRLGVELSSSVNWMGMLAALGMLVALALFGIVMSFSKVGERLWARLAAGIWSQSTTRWVGIPLFFMPLISYSLFTFSSMGTLINSALWARLLVFWFLTLLGAAGFSMWQDRVTFAGGLVLTALSQAIIHRIAMEFPEITNYPFALGWSETTRFYLASLFVSKDVYGQQLALPIINPSLHILLIPPYWVNAPLWFHRFWQIAVRYVLLGLTAWALVKLFPLPKRSDRFVFWLWIYLYLFQGPVYFQLALAALIVLWGYRTRQPLWIWIAILAASAWSGLSRINWFPVPASIAAMLYLLEVPYERGKFWKYVRPPVMWIVAGIATAAVAQRIYILISGVPDPSTFYTSLVSDFLWYRLLPNETYAYGVLPGILLVSLPLILVILHVPRQRWADWHPVRLSFVFLGLLAYFIVGLIVSAKIGGGGDLHNMDAYMLMLLIVSSYLFFGRYTPQFKPQAVPVSVPWSVLMLLVAVPVWFSAQTSARFKSYDHTSAARALGDLQARVDFANAQNRDVLFISQRQMISMHMLEGVNLVPAYEREELMEMAMSDQENYLDAFRADVQNQRFAFIVVDPLKFKLLGSNYSMGEENNAWARRVIKPILCNYEVVVSYPEFQLALYVPQEGTRQCP
ncbi:MAG: hypothetical protein ACXW4U_01140 [Anaerolineales bacterium]